VPSSREAYPTHFGDVRTVRPGSRRTGPGLPVALPGCKSHAQRALILASLLPGVTEIEGVTRGEDIESLASALRACGARFEWNNLETCLRVTGAPTAGGPPIPIDGRRLDLHESATGARALALVASLLRGFVTIDGATGLRARPMAPVAEAVVRAGGLVGGSTLPLRVDGRAIAGLGSEHRGPFEVDATLTTQVATGAALGLALADALGMPLPFDRLVARGATAPGYLAVTVAVLRAFGWRDAQLLEAGGDATIVWGEGPTVTPEDVRRIHVPPDASTALWPATLAVLQGRTPVLQDLERDNPHPDADAHLRLLELAEPGTEVRTVARLGAHPDAFPALCAVAARGRKRGARTVLRGAPALRTKESDRIAAMARGLRAFEIAVEEHDDGLEITAGPDREPTSVVTVPTTPDHRIVMALALVAGTMPAGGRIPHAGAVAKSWPGFWYWLQRVVDVRTT
jgi:3-phosphoshikimate 1-carboxyvinyltransferase